MRKDIKKIFDGISYTLIDLGGGTHIVVRDEESGLMVERRRYPKYTDAYKAYWNFVTPAMELERKEARTTRG